MENGNLSQAFEAVDRCSATTHRPAMLVALENKLNRYGLQLRGGFHPAHGDALPDNIETVLLIGNAGPDMWRVFTENTPDGPHPLDTWTQSVIAPLAARYGAKPVFPFTGPPYYPFQTWAQKADDVHPSPIGPLIHPTYGLWHAYRAALLFNERLDLPAVPRTAPPCEACADKPCLSTCPVEALSDGAYDVPACRTHIAGANGADCLKQGCMARRACPIGRDFAYEPPHAEFHMRSFLTA